MQIINGVCGCEGVARGPVFVVPSNKIDVPIEERIDPREEISKFWNAKERAKEQIEELIDESNKVESSIGDSIFNAYIVYLDDARLKRDIENLIINDNYSAKQAIMKVAHNYQEYIATLSDNPRLQAREPDIEDVMNRLLLCVDGNEPVIAEPDRPSVVVAKELTVSWFFKVNRDNILGFVLEKGSFNSHFAILARSFDIPLLINAGSMSDVREGVDSALYATGDTFVIEPTDEKILEIRQAIEEDQKEKQHTLEYKGRETLTHGGERIILYANVSSLEEIDIALKNDAEGIGLFRTEYLYMRHNDFPTEEEQYRIYREAVNKVDGKIIVFRTADLGADKVPSYIQSVPHINSFMGIRGIRFSMMHRNVFKTQLRAIFRAAYYGIGNVNVMYPMITTIEELDWIDNVRDEIIEELNREHTTIEELDWIDNVRDEIIEELNREHINYTIPEQGIVVETPAAAIASDIFAPRVDFFSIGTNDLSQFLFAIDRMEQHVGIEDFKSLSIRRVMEYIVKTGEREGIPVGLCGDIASDKETLKRILNAGIKGLSIQPRQILLFRKYIREM